VLYLVATLHPAQDAPRLTAETFLELAAAPPHDLLQMFLVSHAACAAKRHDAITLTPDCALESWLHLVAECQACGVTDMVSTRLNAPAEYAIHWWRVLAASLIGAHPDVFLTAKTKRPSRAFRRCTVALIDTIQLGILRAPGDDSPTIH
jgi:hypothetical protein